MSTDLIENTLRAEHDCAWCEAEKGVVHSAACPAGERYKQVQTMGGVPWPLERAAKVRRAKQVDEEAHCLDCGAVVEPFVLACDTCAPQKMTRQMHHPLYVNASLVAVLEADTSGESCRESSPTMERDAAGARDRLVSSNPAMGERGTAGPRNGL